MAERITALQGHYQPGYTGRPGDPGVVMQEIKGLTLHQVAAWPHTLPEVGSVLAQQLGTDHFAGPGHASVGKKGAMLRIEPLKWWLLDHAPPEFNTDSAVVLDLSHARSHMRISGPSAADLLNRHCPLDLRSGVYPVNAVAASMIHHVGITLWHSTNGYELFIPRGFALSIWQGLVDSAQQFGLEIKE